ncbi:hypothetical protein DV711_15305 [Motiliproteus coralliicola]|uniref:Uncharacterized protein n=1 Tax=Motiliproteus coralliicola TaxID=2283196 RepID=A0A369WE52_9GAMM|nr:hypothetical protein [Motiliproteus coralliicola]RDE18974.1 hypothetical protein DV711_15305 [Motiliproteus coralliicola]
MKQMTDFPGVDSLGDWDPDLRFTVEEAVAVLNREVVRLEDRACLPNPPISKTGVVVGVLTMNEQIEVLVKFTEGIEQLVKTEFCGDFVMVED